MTSNIEIDDATFKKLDDKLNVCIEIESEIMHSQEYKDLFEKAKSIYSGEYEYLVHLACISYFNELNHKKI